MAYYKKYTHTVWSLLAYFNETVCDTSVHYCKYSVDIFIVQKKVWYKTTVSLKVITFPRLRSQRRDTFICSYRPERFLLIERYSTAVVILPNESPCSATLPSKALLIVEESSPTNTFIRTKETLRSLYPLLPWEAPSTLWLMVHRLHSAYLSKSIWWYIDIQ